MNDFAWNPEMGKYKYFYKMKVTSKTGKEYWRYYPPRWREGPIICRVKMHPEQAVFTCCSVSAAPKWSGGLSGCLGVGGCQTFFNAQRT